ILDVRVHRVVRGGDAVAGEEVLGEGLAAFELRGGGGGAEDAQAGFAEAVDDAGDQRAFRTDDGERHAFVAREREQAIDVGRGDVGVAALAFGRGAGVAGGDEHLVHARGLCELPGQGVLASAGADDEDLHAWISLRVPRGSGLRRERSPPTGTGPWNKRSMPE